VGVELAAVRLDELGEGASIEVPDRPGHAVSLARCARLPP
jgi:hypothetical protein